MLVEVRGPPVGHSIEPASLRSLPGVYLAEIERDGTLPPAVATERLSPRTIHDNLGDPAAPARRVVAQ
jgi:hypothetical protein